MLLKQNSDSLTFNYVLDASVPKVDDKGQPCYNVTRSHLGSLFKVHPHLKREFLTLVDSVHGKAVDLTREYRRVLRKNPRKRHRSKEKA